LPKVVAGPGTSLCAGQFKPLTASGASSYQWSPAAGLSCTSCAGPLASPAATTLYTVTGSDSFGCQAQDTLRVRVIPDFQLFTSGTSICLGDRAALQANGAHSYQWSPPTGLSATNIANPVATPSATTTYTVTGRDREGCFVHTATATVTINPNSTLYLGRDSFLLFGYPYEFKPQVGGPAVVDWLWTPAAGLSCTTCPNPGIAEVKIDQRYVATITNQFGCRSRDTIRIAPMCPDVEVFIPNILTPDGDGNNDVLVVRARNIKKVTSFKVFNRWGELVYSRNDFPPNERNFGWDGSYKGKLVDPDVFVYVAEVICMGDRIAFYKGNVTVIR
jgi:gliding motility-associated-like protein